MEGENGKNNKTIVNNDKLTMKKYGPNIFLDKPEKEYLKKFSKKLLFCNNFYI